MPMTFTKAEGGGAQRACNSLTWRSGAQVRAIPAAVATSKASARPPSNFPIFIRGFPLLIFAMTTYPPRRGLTMTPCRQSAVI
jgi:hypothetical protein